MSTNVASEAKRNFLAAIEAAARATAIRSVKQRARYYALYPVSLEGIAQGLSFLSPCGMVNRLCDIELPIERLIGFGGEVRVINLKGAMLYARFLRFIAHKSRKVAA